VPELWVQPGAVSEGVRYARSGWEARNVSLEAQQLVEADSLVANRDDTSWTSPGESMPGAANAGAPEVADPLGPSTLVARVGS